MTAHATVDGSFRRLHSAGWSVGVVRLATTAGPLWIVDASRGGHLIITRAPTKGEAWGLACEQAEALGLLGER